MRIFCLLLIGVTFSLAAYSQKKVDNVRLFLDCNAYCDMSFLKTEINYIDFVRDRFLSNLYVMVTSQETGSGGEEIRLFFSGQQEFKGMEDTLGFNRTSVATDAEYRVQLANYLKLGLARYIAKTGFAEKIAITARGGGGSSLNATTAKRDPWNYWVMSLRFNGSYSKDNFNKSYHYSTGLDASRVTEKLKTNSGVFYFNDVTEITVGLKDTYIRSGYGFNNTTVKSLGKHWSVGGSGRFQNNRRSNYKSRVELMPAVEYSVFPYAEAVKKSLTFFYKVGPSWNRYIDSSYYERVSDQLFQHSLSLNIGAVQKWGNVYSNISYEGFLNNFTYKGLKIRGKDVRQVSIGGRMELRLLKGLNFYSSFRYDITKGVFPNIRKGAVKPVEILSNTVQYPTTNMFRTYFGISYRFGSIYNNVVNPRFDSGGGGFFF